MKFQAKITTAPEEFVKAVKGSNPDPVMPEDKKIRLEARMANIDKDGYQPEGAYTTFGWPVRGLGLMQWPKKM